MTDAFDRLKEELRRAAPSEQARRRGIEGAMAAFDETFQGKADEKKQTADDARQGSEDGARLSSTKGVDRRPRKWSGSMSQSKDRSSKPSRLLGLPREVALYGGPSLLAAGLAVAILGGLGDPMRLLSPPSGDGKHAAHNPPKARPKEPRAPGDGVMDLIDLSRADSAGAGGAKKDFRTSAKEGLQGGLIGGEIARDQDRAPLGEALRSGAISPEEATDLTEIEVSDLPRPVVTGEEDESQIGGVRPKGKVAALNSLAEEAEAPQKSGRLTATAPSVEKSLVQEQRRRLADKASRSRHDVFMPRREAERDRFEKVKPNPVRSVSEHPVSTFSIDVDTSAYSFMRASLNRGRLPRPSAVRIEELVNYFDYAYPAPETAETPFKVNVAVTPTPWNAGTRLLHVGVKGYVPPREERPHANLVLLVDVSGSMQAANKLPLAINAFKLLLGELGAEDTVSIVTYAGGVRVALEPTPANQKAKIRKALENLTAGGGTAGAAGLKLAYEKAQEGFDAKAVNRVILATDGDFNIGFSSPEEMKRFVEDKRKSGVFLSALGFGMGNYNSHLMQSLAQNGNGVAAYIDTLSEARKVLADEAGGALIPIAKDVKIQVEFNPAVISEYRLIGYETRALRRQDFKDDKVDAGDIGSGHTATAIYEITPKGSPAELFDPLRYSKAPSVIEAADSKEIALLKLRYKAPDGDVSREIRRPVTDADASQTLASAPGETRFATAVAAFAQILRGDERLSDFGYRGVLSLAEPARGADPFGYRAEFLTLVRLAESLDGRTVKPAARKP